MKRLLLLFLVPFSLPCCAMSGTNGSGSGSSATVTQDVVTTAVVSTEQAEPALFPALPVLPVDIRKKIVELLSLKEREALAKASQAWRGELQKPEYFFLPTIVLPGERERLLVPTPALQRMMVYAKRNQRDAARVRSVYIANLFGQNNAFNLSQCFLQRLVEVFPNLGPITIIMVPWLREDVIDLIDWTEDGSRLTSVVQAIWGTVDIVTGFLDRLVDKFPYIEELKLGESCYPSPQGPRVANARSFDAIARLSRLKKLYLRVVGSDFDGTALRAISAANKNLEYLNLEGNSNFLQPRDFDAIANLHGLTNLHITNLDIDGTALRHIVEANPGIEFLYFGHCSSLIPRDFDEIAKLKKLKIVSAACTSIDETAKQLIRAANPRVNII